MVDSPQAVKGDEGRFVALSEVKGLLERELKERDDLTYEQKLALEHVQAFARLTAKDAEALVKDLMTVEKVSEWHAFKIADVLPTHADDVRGIFAKDRFSLEKDEIDKVLELVAKYV